MTANRNDTNERRSDAAGAIPPPASYLPPAIEWEEPFETTVAASCAHFGGSGGECDPVPSL